MSYLAHHGVLGMKWGVRRYQNKDGSLTTAGIKRYYTDTSMSKSFNEPVRRLGRKGHKLNAKNAMGAWQYRKQVEKKLNKDRHFKELYEKQKNSLEEGAKFRSKVFEREQNNKKLDYYKLKELVADEWARSKQGKASINNERELRAIIDKAAKSGKKANKTFQQLSDINVFDLDKNSVMVETINYGEWVAKSLWQDYRY